MGIRFVEAKEGRVATVMDYKEELTRIRDILHGGIIFYRCGLHRELCCKEFKNKGSLHSTIFRNLHEMIKKSPFKFEAEVIRRAKTYAFVEVRAYDADRTL